MVLYQALSLGLLRNTFKSAIVLLLSPNFVFAAEGYMETKLQEAFAKGELPGLHAVVVMYQGDLVGETYFPGEDEQWGNPLGRVEHGPDTLHDVRSVTKSVVGLLYGIALEEGLVPDLEEPLLAQFPEYADLLDGSDREKITIRDTLSMQMGTAWDESLPYSDPRNSEIAMELADDRYRFALDRPMVAKPGTTWSYNGGAVALIGKLIADGADMPLDEFAKKTLFGPLGITEFEWTRGTDGTPSAASGLRLTARDLSRIGQMVADGGVYEGRRILSTDWLEKSFTPAVELEEGFHYGFLWYLTETMNGERVAIGIGNGGQRLTVQPDAEFVVTSFAGRYNEPDAWQLSLDVLLNFAIPAVRERPAQ